MGSKLAEDDLVDMMHILDADGDGTVTKAEFKVFFMRLKDWTDNARFETEWNRIDSNGDNVLQLSELCEYYGVETKSVEEGCNRRRNMSDQEVLEALHRQAELYQAALEMKAKARQERFNEANTRSAKTGVRSGLVLVEIGKDTIHTDDGARQITELMEVIQVGEFDKFDAMLDECKGINLRIEDEKGEMPIHKLSRKGANHVLKRTLEHMDPETRELDLNASDKNAMLPLFHACVPQRELRGVPQGWVKDFGVITTLEAFGADLFLASSISGWTVLHHAAHNDVIEAAKEVIHIAKVVKATTEVRLHQFVNAVGFRDKRSALHIAAFRCEVPLVKLLLSAGADANLNDAHGCTPLDLAHKAQKRLVAKAIEDHLAAHEAN